MGQAPHCGHRPRPRAPKRPGTPEICNIFTMHRGFSPAADLEWSAQGCRTAGIGCLDCKKRLSENMARELAPVREKYRELVAHPDHVREIMADGAARCRAIAQRTMEEVRDKVGIR